jgi:hypothetical protein
MEKLWGFNLVYLANEASVHGDHPHLQMAHSKYLAHISSYKNSMKNQNQRPKGPKFGSLGGSSVPEAGPNVKRGSVAKSKLGGPRRSLTRADSIDHMGPTT